MRLAARNRRWREVKRMGDLHIDIMPGKNGIKRYCD